MNPIYIEDVMRVIFGGAVSRWRDISAWRKSCLAYPHVIFEKGSYTSGKCDFAEGVKIWSGTKIIDSIICKYTYCSSNSIISKARIGAFCSIGPYVHIGFGRHPVRDYVSTYPSFYSENSAGRASFAQIQRFDEYLPVVIGNDVLISSHCLILDGVTIGDGAIIGAGAVVTKDVQPYSVVGGVPAREIRMRFTQEQIEQLQRIKWWENDIEWIARHAYLFNNTDEFLKIAMTEYQSI